MASIADIRAQRRNLIAQSGLKPSSRKGEIRKARQKEALAIEKDARDHLNRVLLDIASGPSNDISVIQRVFSNEVEDIIRAAANNAYISGINYIANLKQQNHKTYITTPDIATIKALTAEFEQIFWRRVAAVLHQKDIIGSILSARFSTKSKLSLTNIVSGFVVRLVTKAIALGTLAKSKALSNRARSMSPHYSTLYSAAAVPQNQPAKAPIKLRLSPDMDLTQKPQEKKKKEVPPPAVPFVYIPQQPTKAPVNLEDVATGTGTQIDDQLQKTNLDDQLMQDELGLTGTALSTAAGLGTIIDPNEDTDYQAISPNRDVFEWATEEDEKVCPVCQELDGQQWSEDDPDMPVPGSETHDFCRCRLDLVS